MPTRFRSFAPGRLLLILAIGGQAGMYAACGKAPPSSLPPTPIPRTSRIPENAAKVTPEEDANPPEMYLDGYEQPRPIPGRVNTAGAEDSPFISPDGNTLYFFFTPDVNVPVEKQILDGVTGVYVSHRVQGKWEEPTRVVLQDEGQVSLDGCVFILDDTMWFCSVREGWSGIHWFTAKYREGAWAEWRAADWPSAYQVGELHISPDGRELYFASARPGGQGSLDIWVSRLAEGVWQEPENVASINTAGAEGWPALSADGQELWFSRDNSIWVSRKREGKWQEAVMAVSPLAGEPTLDAQGNLYFVHHFFSGGQMLEADIYTAPRKR